MDEKLHIVQHLYGEGDDPEALQRLLEDDGLRADYEALSEAKRYLDGRPPARPDPLVIDRIVAAAVPPRAGVIPGQRKDRAARPNRAGRRYRLVGALSGVVALVLVVGIGLNQFFLQGMERAPADAEVMMPNAAPADGEEAKEFARRNRDEAGALAPATSRAMEERLATAQPDAQDADLAMPSEEEAFADDAAAPAAMLLLEADSEAVAGARLEKSAAGDEAAPTWDEADDLMRVHRRLDMVRARSRELIWDESAVMSLDSLPEQPGRALPGLEAAGKKKQRQQ